MAAIRRGYAGGMRMMMWMAGLAAAIYLSMLFVGRDHGQLRQGLAGQAPAVIAAAPEAGEAAVPARALPASAPPAPAAPAAPASVAPAPVAEVSVAASAATSAPLPQIGVQAEVTIAPAPELAPGEALGAEMVVTARGAVVREGPGIQYRLVGRLTKDAEVQLVDRPAELVGWSVIRFKDGNGVTKQGFVASKLLGKKR